jgi:hypothetical protein
VIEYRGKHYTVVQGTEPDSWRWTVQLDETTAKSAVATSRSAARTSAEWLIDMWMIDKMLEPKKIKSPPSD